MRTAAPPDVSEHFMAEYAGKIDFKIDRVQPYPDRIVGTKGDGTRVSVLIRPVGTDNAGRFRRWVTYRAADFDSMITRPRGWAYYTLMVGLLPDGSPWWTALYDEAYLRRPEVYEHAEVMGSPGRFYRFDPHLCAPALVHEYDFTKAESCAHTVWVCEACGEKVV